MGPRPTVVIFAYRRPDHLRQLFQDLRQSSVCLEDLACRIYVDGPKTTQDSEAVARTIEVARAESPFTQSTVIPRQRNFGLARSLTGGISETLNETTSVVVLEDDLRLSPEFLPFMLEGLHRFESEPSVMSIQGHMYPVPCRLPETLFLKGADCWGWATWRDSWSLYRPDAGVLLREVVGRGLANEFDYDSRAGFTSLLRGTARGLVDSWAIRWHASVFLRGGVSLYPGQSLVKNEGSGAGSTHGAPVTQVKRLDERSRSIDLTSVRLEAPSRLGYSALVEYFGEEFPRSSLVRVAKRLRNSRPFGYWPRG